MIRSPKPAAGQKTPSQPKKVVSEIDQLKIKVKELDQL